MTLKQGLDFCAATVLHPLPPDAELPARLNNPFDYEPCGLCRFAASQLQDYLSVALGTDVEGKMFGVLVVGDAEGSLYYLAAYSGQCEQVDQRLFVPAVFDYLQPDGYFKQHEQEIVDINHKIKSIESSEAFTLARQQLQDIETEADAAIEEAMRTMREAKQQRDLRRQSSDLSPDDQAAMTRESQFLKAEVRRTKARYKPLLSAARSAVQDYEHRIEDLRRLRRQQSDSLQRWLFSHFLMHNGLGEERPLTAIFSDYYREETKIPADTLPPSGSGECCEPKLLQYAFLHALRPRAMAMFWWGRSPEAEVRHHGQFYPACQGKCRPLLPWMLRGIDVEPLSHVETTAEPQVIYQDSDLVVVNKPAGLLSVPGKGQRPSVYSWAVEHYGQEAMLPHRLDMDTSGLLLIALNREAYINLQQQFRRHEVQKHYVALLDGVPKQPKGLVDLPLSADLNDRPRQKVDRESGAEAQTTYIIRYARQGEAVVDLYPRTGRTHQLRLHCAHHDGLAAPIKGDRLYGKVQPSTSNLQPSTSNLQRLCLHAEEISFRHPRTGELMHFRVKADFTEN